MLFQGAARASRHVPAVRYIHATEPREKAELTQASSVEGLLSVRFRLQGLACDEGGVGLAAGCLVPQEKEIAYIEETKCRWK